MSEKQEPRLSRLQLLALLELRLSDRGHSSCLVRSETATKACAALLSGGGSVPRALGGRAKAQTRRRPQVANLCRHRCDLAT